MESSAITKGSINEALNLNISFDINDRLHDAFTVRYSTAPKDNILHDISNVPTPCLQSTQAFETWQGVDSTTSTINHWQLFNNDQYLLAAVPVILLEHLPIDQATEKAYSMIFEQLQECGYPYLIRTWNFFPDITQDSYASINNYQLFCSGRSRAYAQHSLTPQPYPAATVIGTHDEGLYIYFIAAKNAGIGIENTKQVSAFEYPTSYSEDPPLFSRALLHQNQYQQILFISGTASITGHNTQYEGDVNRQTEVCLENIQHLLSTAVHEHQFANIALSEFTQFKVYIKHPEHLETVKTHVQHQLGIRAPIIYLQADMCRSDLLVEIEALAISPLI